MSLRRICPINDSEIPAPRRDGVLGYSCQGRSVAGILGLPGLRTAGLTVDPRLGQSEVVAFVPLARNPF